MRCYKLEINNLHHFPKRPIVNSAIHGLTSHVFSCKARLCYRGATMGPSQGEFSYLEKKKKKREKGGQEAHHF